MVLLGIRAKASRQQQILNLVFIIMQSTKGGEANGITHFTGIVRYEQWIQVIAVQRSRMAADHRDESSLVMAYVLRLITLILPTLNCKL